MGWATKVCDISAETTLSNTENTCTTKMISSSDFQTIWSPLSIVLAALLVVGVAFQLLPQLSVSLWGDVFVPSFQERGEVGFQSPDCSPAFLLFRGVAFPGRLQRPNTYPRYRFKDLPGLGGDKLDVVVIALRQQAICSAMRYEVLMVLRAAIDGSREREEDIVVHFL